MEALLVVLVIWLVLSRRRERRRHRRERRRAGDARGGAVSGALRDVVLADGRPALEVTGSMFEPSVPDEPGWTRVTIAGTAATQAEHDATVREVGGDPSGQVVADGLPVVLMALGTRRRVNAVDVYAAGGRLGHLPDATVARYGEGVRRVQAVDGRPAGVRARIVRTADGLLGTEVLLPDGFTAGAGRE